VLNKEQVIKEIVRCGKDPNYFIENYVRISHPEQGPIPFRTYPFQKDLLQDYNAYRFNIILKGRQLGISTITAAYSAWLILFHREKNILVVATKLSTAGNLVKKVKFMIKNLPPWLQIADISIDNRNSFELTNGSQIKASSTSGDAGRSEALSLLVVDEAAHVDGLDELWKGLYPTLSTGGRCIALSTPNGIGNWFYRMYSDADAGLNDFHPTSLPWHLHPDRDEEWFKKETRNMTKKEIAQELECSFLSSGETVIDAEYLEWVYDPASKYFMTVDVARGDGEDYSAFHVWNITTNEIVAEYQGKVAIDMYANMVHQAATRYGTCLVVVESNNIGFMLIDKLKDLRYNNLYYSKGDEFIDPLIAENITGATPGFTTSSKTRPLIIAKMEEMIRNQLVITRSKRLFGEFKTFVWKNGRPQAMRSKHDDLVMSFAIACWIRDAVYEESAYDREKSEKMMNAFFTDKRELNTTIPGMIGHLPVMKSGQASEAKKQQQQYSWLYKG
jgi:hypothetical protein